MHESVLNTQSMTLKPLTIALLLGVSAPTLAEPVTSVDDFFQPDGMTATAENYPTLETSRQLLIAQGRAAVNEIAHNRKLKDEARRKKEMHGEVRQQLCERLCITDEQFTAIIDEETMGTDAIIALVDK